MINRLTKRYLAIKELLSPYHSIWQREVLNYYPSSLSSYPLQWVEELVALNSFQQFKIDARVDYDNIENIQLKSLFEELRAISLFDQADQYHTLPLFHPHSTTYLGVKDKKKHELERFFSYFNQLQQVKKFNRITNIGGGVGHISRIMTQHFNLDSTDIDMNAEFQKIGREKLRLYPEKPSAPTINFVTLKLDDTTAPEFLAPHFTGDTFTTGLHTCGELAVRHLKMAVDHQVAAVLNFGCCYGLIEEMEKTRLSNFTQQNPIHFTPHALTLATRAHSEESEVSFNLKKRVKSYRYALHLYNLQEENISEFLTVGNGNEALYRGEFADYYLFMMKRLGITVNTNQNKLNNFYQSEEIQLLLKKMFAMDLIRWQFGRPLEIALLLDRGIFLAESGMEVQFFTLFDELISPRNIGILGITP